MRTGIGRAGATVGDIVLTLSLLSLAGALLLPTLRRVGFDRRLEAIAGGVEALRTAASAAQQRTGAWPPPSAPGEAPEAISSSLPADAVLAGAGYSIAWGRVSDVEVPVLPPDAFVDVPESPDGTTEASVVVPSPTFWTRGLVVVHSGDEDILGALLQRYGTVSSFVRDTTWTLLLPRSPDSGS